MTKEEFQRLVERHKGLDGEPVVIDPKIKKKDRYGEESEVPNPNPRRRYVFKDGTSLEGTTADDGGVNVTSPGTAMKPDSAGAKPRTVKIGNDLYEEQSDGSFSKVIDTPDAPKSTTVSTSANEPYIVTRNPDGTTKQEPNPNYVRPKADLPEVTAPSRRTGQKTDPGPAVQQYTIVRSQLASDVQAGRITQAEATKKLGDYYDQNVKPVLDQATREANEAAEETRRQQAESHAASLASSNATVARSNALTANDADRLAFDRNKVAIEAGKDAVANAREVSKSRLGSGQFGQHLSEFLSGGAGSMPRFSASDLQHQDPDYDAIAEQATQRVLQRLGVMPSPTTAPAQQPAPVPTAPASQTTPPSAAPTTTNPAALIPRYGQPPVVPPEVPFGGMFG